MHRLRILKIKRGTYLEKCFNEGRIKFGSFLNARASFKERPCCQSTSDPLNGYHFASFSSEWVVFIFFDKSCSDSYKLLKTNLYSSQPVPTENTYRYYLLRRPTSLFENGEDIRRCLIWDYRFIHHSMTFGTIPRCDSIFAQNNDFCLRYFPYFLGFALSKFIFQFKFYKI